MDYSQKLEELRNTIDTIDHDIYTSILKRFDAIVKIAELKRESGIMEMSQQRRDEIIMKVKEWAIKDGIPTYLVLGIFNQLIDASVLEQTLIIHEKKYD